MRCSCLLNRVKARSASIVEPRCLGVEAASAVLASSMIRHGNSSPCSHAWMNCSSTSTKVGSRVGRAWQPP